MADETSQQEQSNKEIEGVGLERMNADRFIESYAKLLRHCVESKESKERKERESAT